MTLDENERLTAVGPGTEMGGLLRCYWHPIAACEEMSGKVTKPVRLLGESLILFRDLSGKLGLVGERCAHRRASLLFGMPDEDGIRCAYHGWRYDRQGRCTDMPNEPAGAAEKRCLEIRGYPVAELGGLIFAYLGPPPAPALPPWSLLHSQGSPKDVVTIDVPCNWLQVMENSVDRVHFQWLHTRFHAFAHRQAGTGTGGDTDREIKSQRIADRYEETPYGLVKREYFTAPDGVQREVLVPFLFPTGGQTGLSRVPCLQLRVPIDDVNTRQYFYTLYDLEPAVKADLTPRLGEEIVSGRRVPHAHLATPRIDDEIDYALLTSNVYQDVSIISSQGAVHDRSRENLASSDTGVVMFRKLLERELQKVGAGEIPLNVSRDPACTIVELPRRPRNALSTLYPRAQGRPSGNVQSFSPFLADLEKLGVDVNAVLLAP